MTKWQFVQVLKSKGYAVDESAHFPTVLMVGASREEIKQKFFEIKRLAQKVGYNHSLKVKNLEESYGNSSNNM